MKLSPSVCATAFAATLLLVVCAQAQYKEKDLHNFVDEGYATESGLTMDRSGNLYGVADTFFEFTPNGPGWTYNDLGSGLAYAFGPMVMDQAGNFYTSNYFASVVEYSPDGSGGFTSSTIWDFDGGPSNLLIDGAGNLYATVAGPGLYGFGYVAELSPVVGGGWSEADLYDFRGKNGAVGAGVDDGTVGGLILDASGNLYGVTTAGGFSTNCSGGCGVVFELTNHSGVWTETLLHSFSGTDGEMPDASLLMDKAGNLYGTTALGGASGWGEVFELSQVSGQWHIRVLYNFTDGADGAIPQAALITDAAGNLYGTTQSGGANDECSVGSANGCGTVFKLSRNGTAWEETVLHGFTGGLDGAFPAGLILDARGNLYSTAAAGGPGEGRGLVFELSPER